MQFTDFQKKKLQRVYKMKDFNGDGKISIEDFVLWGEKACEQSGQEYTDARKDAWKSAYQVFFANDSGSSFDGWVKATEAFADIEDHVNIAASYNLKLFDCIDTNGDGEISWKEFLAFIKPLGVTEEGAKVAFEMIDENGDGILSKDELSVACARYYFDKETTKYSQFYGPWAE